MNAANAYIQLEMARHAASVTAATARVNAAGSLSDLVRVVSHLPRLPPLLRCVSTMRSADMRLGMLVERRVDDLVSQRLDKMQALLGREDYCAEAGKLRQELRMLSHAAPRVVTAAMRRLEAMSASSQPTQDPIRQRRG